MNNNIENSKNNQWENIEKKSNNWFREKWESIKNFLEWEKNIVKRETSETTDTLKDSAIDSQLQDLEKNQEIQDYRIDTKKELDEFLIEWRWKKDSKDVLREKELAQELLNNDRFKNRSPETVQEIAKSAIKVENEIKQWQSVFSKMAWKIMDTEK